MSIVAMKGEGSFHILDRVLRLMKETGNTEGAVSDQPY